MTSHRSPDLKKAMARIMGETRCAMKGAGIVSMTPDLLVPRIEELLISATWTLRRIPNPGPLVGWVQKVSWLVDAPEEKRDRITAEEIDRMQGGLDMLNLLPDVDDRRLLFWAAWHQEGGSYDRIPWAKVRRSLETESSRWTLKRHYDAGLLWIAKIIMRG